MRTKASIHEKTTGESAEIVTERISELHTEPPQPAAVVVPNNTKALGNLGISEAEGKELPKLSATTKTITANSRTPIAESMSSASAFSFSINDNLRRVTPGRTNDPNSNRHSVGDMNKLLEQNREATTAIKEKQHPPALTIRRSFSVGATSPTKAESTPNTPSYQSHRPSGAKMADRMAWIRELEEKSSGKGSPGRAAMYRNLQGGVANKLARFESSNMALTDNSGSGLVRTNSVSSRVSISSEAYGIESVGMGSRLSRASTMDEEFRRKMEEVAEKAKKKIEKDGDQEALIAQVNRDAELALKEEKRRSLMIQSAGPFNYAFDEKAGRKTNLAPVTTQSPAVVEKSADPADAVDLKSFTPTRRGSTKMPKFSKEAVTVAGSANAKPAEKFPPPEFRLKNPDVVAASATPPVELGKGKISAPVFRVKDPNAVAVSANPSIALEAQCDDGEYDPFNPTKYPVASSISALQNFGSNKTQGEGLGMKASAPQVEDETTPPSVPELVAAAPSKPLEETKTNEVASPSANTPTLEPVSLVSVEADDKTKAEVPADQAPHLEEKAETEVDATCPVAEETKPDVKSTKAEEPTIPQPTKTLPTPFHTENTNAVPSVEFPSTSSETKLTPVPTINTTPPTPPAKKEVAPAPVPKYVALRERAQKAAALSGKPAPAPVSTSQTFNRMFGPPIPSGRSPVPAPAPRKAVMPVKSDVDAQKEKQAKEEMPTNDTPTKEVLANESSEETSPPTTVPTKEEAPMQEAEKGVSESKDILNVSMPASDAEEAPASNASISKSVPSQEKRPAVTTSPAEKLSPMEKQILVEQATPIAKSTQVQKEIPNRKVTPFPVSMPIQKAAPIKQQAPIQEQESVKKEDSITSTTPPSQNETPLSTAMPVVKENPVTPAKTRLSNTSAPNAAGTKDETPAMPKMGGSSVDTTSGSNSPATPTFSVAKMSAFGDDKN